MQGPGLPTPSLLGPCWALLPTPSLLGLVPAAQPSSFSGPAAQARRLCCSSAHPGASGLGREVTHGISL